MRIQDARALVYRALCGVDQADSERMTGVLWTAYLRAKLRVRDEAKFRELIARERKRERRKAAA